LFDQKVLSHLNDNWRQKDAKTLQEISNDMDECSSDVDVAVAVVMTEMDI